MLQNNRKEQSPVLKTHGYLVSVQVEDWVDITRVTGKLKDSLTWVEGIGEVEVDYLGEIDVVEEDNNGS